MNLYRIVLLIAFASVGFGCTDSRELPAIVVERANWWKEQIEGASHDSHTPKSLASDLHQLGAAGKLETTGKDNTYAAKLERVVSEEAFCGYEDLMLIAYFDKNGQLEDHTINASAVCIAGEVP